jgi:hypothetical protein
LTHGRGRCPSFLPLKNRTAGAIRGYPQRSALADRPNPQRQGVAAIGFKWDGWIMAGLNQLPA